MNYEEFLKEYKIEQEYEECFLSKGLFNSDLKALGWKLVGEKYIHYLHSEFNDIDIVCTNPNFYKDGHVIAQSRKSVIISSGFIQFEYPLDKSEEVKQYTSFYPLFMDNGWEVIGNLNQIKWHEVKDWLIVAKKDGKLLSQFDSWENCPTRKEVEC